MRMTSRDTCCGSNPRPSSRLARAAAVALLAGTLVVGCGGGDADDAAREARAEKRAKAEAAVDDTVDTVAATPPSGAAEKQSRLADAVVDSKTTAPVDMKYDLLAKPEVGVPFEVELMFTARLPAESIEVEVTEAAGLTIVGEKAAKFTPVEAGQSYTARVLVQGDKAGLFYVGIVARMLTQVQTETRVFAVPVVIGNLPVAQKIAPAKDATGQAVQSLPAQEPK